MNAKTILISGASSGLGAAMAREFAARGYHLALCARRTDRLASLCEALSKAHGIRAEALSLDVNGSIRCLPIFANFTAALASWIALVVNAGISVGRRIGAGRFAENRAAAETNFVAALAQCEAAVEIFRQQNASHLVLISSMSAMRGLPRRLTTYAATKAGLAHLDEGIRPPNCWPHRSRCLSSTPAISAPRSMPKPGNCLSKWTSRPGVGHWPKR